MAVRVRFVCALVALVALAPPRVASHRAPGVPRLMLWAWERPEDLRGLPRGVGVAFLAQTIGVRDGRTHVAPRRQPLRVDRATALVAVTRIETDPAEPLGRPGDVDAIVDRIARTAALPRVIGVQVDFDARESERGVYRELLRALRQRLAPGTSLSITALASWCAADDWLRGATIDEAVPMLFRMGPFDRPFVRLAASDAWPARECRGSIGTSLDEPIALRASGRRAYVFSPNPWNAVLVANAQHRAGP